MDYLNNIGNKMCNKETRYAVFKITDIRNDRGHYTQISDLMPNLVARKFMIELIAEDSVGYYKVAVALEDKKI